MSATKRKVTKHGNNRWEVDFGLVNGKRIRPLFSTEMEADKAIEKWERERKRQGDMWLSLPMEERQSILATISSIRSAGYTLAKVWEGFQQWVKDKAAKPTIASVPYRDAVEKHAKAKNSAGKDSRYCPGNFDAPSQICGRANGKIHFRIHPCRAKRLDRSPKLGIKHKEKQYGTL
jgi:hypothetical protein